MTHIISYSLISFFSKAHPDAKAHLDAWYQLVSKSNFSNFNALTAAFPGTTVIKNKKGNSLTVFNINVDNIRVIAAVHYDRNNLYIRDILTSAEYEKWLMQLMNVNDMQRELYDE